MGKILIRNDTATIGATSTVVLTKRDRGRRVAFTILNTSTGGQTISLAFGDNQAAVAGSGIPLPPLAYYLEDGSGSPCFDGIVSAISSAAGGTVGIMERVVNEGNE
jgi:hypothetical protein